MNMQLRSAIAVVLFLCVGCEQRPVEQARPIVSAPVATPTFTAVPVPPATPTLATEPAVEPSPEQPATQPSEPTQASESTPTTIFEALENADVQSAKAMLDQGVVDPNIRDSLQRTPLHVAAQYGLHEIVGDLLARGAQIDARERDGRTPLHFAAMEGRTAIVEQLIASGALVAATDKFQATPLYYAVRHRHADTQRVLRAHGAQYTIQLAAVGGDLVALQEVLSATPAILNSTDEAGFTALHHAVRERQSDAVKLLLDAGADTDLRTLRGGMTPLHIAVDENQGPIVELLLAAGADVNARDELGRTPLSLALRANRTELAQLLQQHGAQE